MSTVDGNLVSIIYSGISESPPWHGLSQYICEKTKSILAHAFFYRSPRTGLAMLNNQESEFVKNNRLKYLKDFVSEDPVPYLKLKSSRIYAIEEFVSREKLEQSRYYREFLQPAGMEQFITIHLDEPSGFKLWVNIARPKQLGPYAETEIQWFESFMPHLQRALALFAQIKRMQLSLNVHRELIENLTIGIILVDNQGNIVDSNRAADRILQANDLVKSSKPQLWFRSFSQMHEFTSALTRVINGEVPAAALFVKNHASAGGLEILISPLKPFLDFGSDHVPNAVVCISNSAKNRSVPGYLLIDLFNLTQTEAYLAILLIQGLALSEAANEMSITENSARTYLKRIFAKTGVHRQSELVSLILNSVASLIPHQK